MHFALAFFFSFKSYAQEEPAHHENHYHFSGFAGFTADYKGQNGYKLGLEYEYRLNDYFGIGGTFDFTGADFQIFGLSAGFSTYPFKVPLVLALGAGGKHSNNHWKYFTRGLATYDFHLEDISIGPMIMYDAFPSEKDIFTIGMSIGFSLK
ncbi:hypothetical protein [Flavicella marina]|uniref:hypothetical protein n=1 Tax=Flavicella marina TaxID=1475951 RepID=UPI0012655F6D|nr:hypothetical protein [Flavicella marina]